MKKSGSSRIVRLAATAALGALIVISAGLPGARAADDDSEEDAPADVKFFRNILAGLGWKRDGDGIDYRERSPLVVPPSMNLPPPEPGNIAARNPAWPKDPDIQRAKKLKAERKKPQKTVEEESLPELPGQLNRPGAAVARATRQAPAPGNPDPTKPSTPSELGAKTMLTVNALLGRDKEEYATFVAEPPRETLIEPPPGYRTPSPAQPYGVGKQKWLPGALNPMDTPAMRGTDN